MIRSPQTPRTSRAAPGRAPAGPGGRRGVLVLWLAIAGVVILIVWGIARSFVTSSLRHEAEADLEGSLVKVLAESTVAEMEARIGYDVNALGSPVAAALRRPVLSGESGQLELTPYAPYERTAAMLSEPEFRGYSIDDAQVRVAFQRQIDCVPSEKRALLVFSATVSSPGLVRRTLARLELARWAKITLTAPPRPFGNFGLFLLNATGLTDATAVNAQRDRALALCRRVRAALRERAGASSDADRQSLEQLLRASFDPDGPVPPPAPFALPDGAALYGLAESREPQELKALDLAAHMRDLEDRAERALSDPSSAGGEPGGTQESGLVQAARRALAAAVAPLQALWTFERNYAVLAPGGGKAWTDLAAVAYKLGDDYFRRRAHYRLTPSRGHPDLTGDLAALLARPVQGVIALDNESAPVTVSGPVRGRVVLVAGPGGINLRSVNETDVTTGMVTVVCASGPVHVSGKNTLWLILPDAAHGQAPYQLTMDPDSAIRGGLVATTVPSGGWQDGELSRDDRGFSGFTDRSAADRSATERPVGDRVYVGLSPRIFYRRLVRL